MIGVRWRNLPDSGQKFASLHPSHAPANDPKVIYHSDIHLCKKVIYNEPVSVCDMGEPDGQDVRQKRSQRLGAEI